MDRSALSHGYPPKLFHGITYGCMALGGLCWFTYSGPYRWLAELQLDWFEVYYATYTWIGASLVLMVPAFFALHAARMAGLIGTVEEGWRGPSQARGQALVDRFQHYRLPLFVLFVGGCFLFMGARNYLRGRQGRTLESLDIQALEAGKRPASTWVEITGGTARWDASMTWKDRTEHVYVPVLSEGWKEGAPVGLLLELRPYEQADAHKAEVFRGATYEFGLPGPVRTRYVEAGYPVDEALIVNLNVVPSAHQDSDLQFCFLGAGVMCLGLGLGYWKRRGELAA